MNQPTPNQSPVQALVNRLESYLVTQNYTVDTPTALPARLATACLLRR
jgi:hypothetical protein